MDLVDNLTSRPRVGPAKVLAAAATGSVSLFHKYGGDTDRIFGRAGLRINDISSPLEELNLQKFCNLFEEAAQSTGNSNIGLEFGQNFTPKKLGMLGFAAISAPTLAASLRTLEKYFPAHQDQTIRLIHFSCDLGEELVRREPDRAS